MATTAATTLSTPPRSASASHVTRPVPWQQQRRSVRACYVLILLTLAGCAFADSFVALAELARATGALPGTRAYTLPLMLDGLTLAGTLFAVTRFGPGQGSPAYGYVLIALGSLASLAGNVAHAPAAPGARVIAGAPPLILCLVFEAAAISFRRRPQPAPGVSEPVGQPAPAGPEPAVGGTDPAVGGAEPDGPPGRHRAERIWAEHAAAGQPLSGARLAELAGISPRYSRSLLAEFRAQPPIGPAHTNGQPALPLGLAGPTAAESEAPDAPDAPEEGER